MGILSKYNRFVVIVPKMIYGMILCWRVDGMLKKFRHFWEYKIILFDKKKKFDNNSPI